MKKLHLFYYFLINSLFLSAQPTSVSAVFNSVNQRFTSVKKGYYETSVRWKSAMKEDTSIYKAQVYFFKEEDDNTAKFVAKWGKDDLLMQIYDGVQLYSVNPKKQFITSYYKGEDGKQVFKGNFGGMAVFLPYLLTKPAIFPIEKYDSSSLKVLKENKEKILLVTLKDTLINNSKITSKDPDVIFRKIEYEITYPDYQIRRHTDLVSFTSNPQYTDTRLSNIKALPDSVTFEKMFNLDSLLKVGYKLRDGDAIQKEVITQQPTLIKEGDVLPDFAMVNLEGDTVRASDLRNGLILLDFWYKSCFPCLKAMPAIERLYQKQHSLHLTVLGINPSDKDPLKLRQFMEDREFNYPSLLDVNKIFIKKTGINAFPTMLLVDAETKKVLLVQQGYAEELEADLIQLIEKINKE